MRIRCNLYGHIREQMVNPRLLRVTLDGVEACQ